MELSIGELRNMQSDRDALISRIATLEAKPEFGTYNELAEKVIKYLGSGYTPDQKNAIREAITNRGVKPT